MTLKEDVLEFIVNQLGGRVVIAFNLVADHLHLLVDLVLGIGAVEDDVRQQVDGLGEVFFGDGSVVDRVLLIGKGIQLTAYTLEGIDDLQGVATLGALEGHVLAEMGQTFLARQFVTGTSCYLVAAVDHL